MFGLFKNKKNRVSNYLREWQIPVDKSFELIINEDSWQFVNEDGSRVLYFSILNITGDPSILGGSLSKAKPTVKYTEHRWQLKGTKTKEDKILVCVFSFVTENDLQWAEELFENITFVGT